MDISKLLFLALCLFAPVSCSRPGAGSVEKETLYQVATLQSLMAGNYDGYVSVGELRAHGDVGLGTFDRLNGEMIVLDGCVYQALGDGTVVVADDSGTTPFSTVTWFDADLCPEIQPFDSLSGLESQLDSAVYAYGRNFIYAVCLDINVSGVVFRSELPQEKPYGPLSEVLQDRQRTFACENISGTVVGVCFPSFFSGQNTTGWHFHFISSDRKQGGHLLEISSSETSTAQLDATPYFNLYLPQDCSFSRRNLSEDFSDAIELVEHSAR